MTPETVMTIGQRALEMALMLAAPLLLTVLLIGLLVGVFQAATQINEMTLSFIPEADRHGRCARDRRSLDAQAADQLHAHAVRKHSDADRIGQPCGEPSMPVVTVRTARGLDRQRLLAVRAYRRLSDGGADVRRELRAGAAAHRDRAGAHRWYCCR